MSRRLRCGRDRSRTRDVQDRLLEPPAHQPQLARRDAAQRDQGDRIVRVGRHESRQPDLRRLLGAGLRGEHRPRRAAAARRGEAPRGDRQLPGAGLVGDRGVGAVMAQPRKDRDLVDLGRGIRAHRPVGGQREQLQTRRVVRRPGPDDRREDVVALRDRHAVHGADAEGLRLRGVGERGDARTGDAPAPRLDLPGVATERERLARMRAVDVLVEAGARHADLVAGAADGHRADRHVGGIEHRAEEELPAAVRAQRRQREVAVGVVDEAVRVALLHAGRDADRDEVEVRDRRLDGHAFALEHAVRGAGVATRTQRRVLVEPDDDDPMVVEDDDPRPAAAADDVLVAGAREAAIGLELPGTQPHRATDRPRDVDEAGVRVRADVELVFRAVADQVERSLLVDGIRHGNPRRGRRSD